MNSRKNKAYKLFYKKLSPHLPAEIASILPIELWNLVAQYGFWGKALHCPLSGELFYNPVVVDHPRFAPLVYERSSIKRRLELHKRLRNDSFFERFLRNEELILPLNINKLLRPVPVVRLLRGFTTNHNELTPVSSSFRKLLSDPKRKTNITEELSTDIIQAKKLSSKQISDYLNTYDVPICARRDFAKNFIFRPAIFCGLFTLFEMGSKLLQFNSEKIDMNLVLLVMLHGMNSYKHFFRRLNFMIEEMRVLGMPTTHQEFRDLGLHPERINGILMHKFLKLAKIVFLKNDFIGSLESSFESTLLTLSGYFSIAYVQRSPLILGVLPTYIAGGRQIVKEYKNVVNNPFSLFQASRDVNGFIESTASKTMLRLGQISTILLMTILAFCATENPGIALLAFVAAFISEVGLQAEDNYRPKFRF